METVVIKGSHFFLGNSGAQFFIRGINYQDDGNAVASAASYLDPLENSATCERDAKYLEDLGVNTIVVQWLNPQSNHLSCMQTLERKGIYVLAGLGAPNEMIQQRQIWDRELQDRFRNVIDSLRVHPNLLGFFITGSSITLPFVRAAIRDLKQYLKDNNQERTPIGYMSMYNRKQDLFQALTCGGPANSIDFLILQESECSSSPQVGQTMQNITREYVEYPKPVMYSAEDCSPQLRSSVEAVQLMNDPKISNVLSGAVLFSYFSSNAFNISGIVSISGNNVRKTPEFNAMSSEMRSVQPSQTQISTYKPTKTAPASCTSPLTLSYTIASEKLSKTTRLIIATDLPPTPDSKLCECMVDSLDCVANPITPGTTEIEPNSMETVVALPVENTIVQSICTRNATNCLDSRVDIVNGLYGTFSSCNATERGSWMLNQYYRSKNGDSSACTPLGGYLRTNRSSQPQSNDCGLILRQAGLPGNGKSGSGLDGSQNSLSGSARAGIAIGVVSFVALVAGFIFLWLRKRKENALKKQAEGNFAKAELPDNSINPRRDGPFEVSGTEEILELDANPGNRSPSEDMAELPTPQYDGSPGTQRSHELVELPTPKLDDSPRTVFSPDEDVPDVQTPQYEGVSPYVETQSAAHSPVQFR